MEAEMVFASDRVCVFFKDIVPTKPGRGHGST